MLKKVNQEQKILFVVGICTLLLLIIGSTYAYFVINNQNKATQSKATGQLTRPGDLTLTTNTNKLYLSLSANNMAEENKGTIYYANSDSKGTPILNPTLGNGIYNLATVSLSSGEIMYNCNYKYKLTGTITKPITGGSDEDIKVKISGDSIQGGSQEYTLKQIVNAGSNGIDITGTFKKVTTGENQTITIESSVANTEELQDELSGSSYTINIEPYAGTEGFSCSIASPYPMTAEDLIATGELWQSGLEGDGYRYTGSGAATAGTSPKNFVCFGTNDKATCTGNPNTYMYRIIGVFPDASGTQYVKLIKYASLTSAMAWNAATNRNDNWENATLYNELNGSLFLNNKTFIPNNIWSDKIVNWKWMAVQTDTWQGSGDGLDYDAISVEQIYLHEMNRSNKPSAIGTWTTPMAKIGLMYASDYMMSLGSSSLNYSGILDYEILSSGWMDINNNNNLVGTDGEWIISSDIDDAMRGHDYTWCVGGGFLASLDSSYEFLVRPTFYLNSDVELQSGSGTIDDPYIIKE